MSNYATAFTLTRDNISRLEELADLIQTSKSEVVRRAIDLLYQQVSSGDYSVELAKMVDMTNIPESPDHWKKSL